MSPELAAFLSTHHHVVTTAEARELGVSRETLRSYVRRGLLTRVAQGAYVQTSAVAALTHEPDRHLLVARAVLRSRPGAWAASHVTAAVVWGLPVLASTLDRVHVVHARPVGSVRRHDAFTVHTCPGTAYLVECRGVPTVTPEVAVVGTALLGPLHSGVMAIDAALRGGFCTPASLQAAVDRCVHVAGVGRARRALAAADRSAESPGESWLRLILRGLGYRVVPQHPVRDERGRLVGRVDFYLPDLGVVVEFDGKVKYEGVLPDGRSPSEAVVAERARERRIRRLGYGVARVIWGELFDVEQVRREVEEAARSARRDRVALHEQAQERHR